MRQVIVTDVRYRTAMAVIRPLAKAGYEVCGVQTKQESPAPPPAFSCKYLARRELLDGSVHDDTYPERLLALCREYDRPVLLPIGADTLAMLAANADRFRAVCELLIPTTAALDTANDKRAVAQLARQLGIPVPEEYCGTPDRFPVIIKPRCGEKLGLHAEQRYVVADNAEHFADAYRKMSALDPHPVVQELLRGDGEGVCLVMDEAHQPVSIFCHRRVREYPISGGPSACCISTDNETLAAYAVRLLQAFDFTGIAMVEFKDGRLLEINPRIWGSFPLTEKSGSAFIVDYVRAAVGEQFPSPDRVYRRGRRMRFVLNDTLSLLSHLRHGHLKTAAVGALDIFRAKEALFSFSDQKPFWRYLFQALRRKGSL